MATLQMTSAAVLDTITEVASSATSVVKTVSAGAHMIHAHVTDMQREQARDLLVNRAYRDAARLQAKAQQITLLREQSRQFCNSAERKKDFDEVYAHLKSILSEADKAA